MSCSYFSEWGVHVDEYGANKSRDHYPYNIKLWTRAHKDPKCEGVPLH